LNSGGISVPYMTRLIGAMEEKEKINARYQSIKESYSKSLKYLKETQG